MQPKTGIVQTDSPACCQIPGHQPDGKRLLERILSHPLLPSPPTLALQVVEKVSQPDCDIPEVCVLLASDPALCGRLLKVVNSVAYSPNRSITAIDHAVGILGFNRLRSLVLGMSIPSLQFGSHQDPGLSRFWKCSVTGGIIAREIARLLRYPAPEEDMVAALLRDLGIILLRQSFPEAYQPVWTGERQLWAGQRCGWEEERFGVDHAEVGAELLRGWRLPDAIVLPIRYHHYPQRMPSAPSEFVQRARLLEFAGRLSELEDAEHTSDDLQDIWRIARDQFALDPGLFKEFLIAISPKIEEFAALLQMEIGNPAHFTSVLSAGYQELARLSVDLAGESPHGQSDSRNSAGNEPTHGDSDAHVDTRPAAIDPECAGNGSELPGIMARIARLGDFHLLKKLGEGGMGEVFQARQIGLDRDVAVKVLASHAVNDATFVQRFQREARVMAKLAHPHILSCYAVGEQRGLHYLAIEYAAGGSLADWLKKLGKLSVGDALHVVMVVADALQHAHESELIHRDIKPENILITGQGVVKVADLGLAKSASENLTLTRTGAGPGTPTYMSPEQTRDARHVDARSDIYSLGCVFYNCLTGAPPFEGETFIELFEAKEKGVYAPASALNEEVPARLDAIIGKMLARKANDRYQTCADLIRDLAELDTANPTLGFFSEQSRSRVGPPLIASPIASHSGKQSIMPASETRVGKPPHRSIGWIVLAAALASLAVGVYYGLKALD